MRMRLALLPSVFAASQSCVQLPQPFSVTSVKTALQLTQALSCSNGSYEVTWCGRVTVPETLAVGARTELTITSCADKTAVIDGGNSTQLFNVDGQLHLVNVTLRDAYSADAGAAITGQAGSQVTATNCQFSRNMGETYGIVYLAGKAVLTACDFIGNTVTDSDYGTLTERAGSAVHGAVSSSLSVSSCLFFGNLGKTAVYVDGKAHFSSCRWQNNYAKLRGGALNAASAELVSVEDCIFLNNTTTEDMGGAVTGVNMMLNRCSFIGNRAEFAGGAIGIAIGAITMTDCYFAANAALLGGALVSFSGTMNVTGSTFIENAATDSGGCYFGYESTAVVTNSTFSRNSAGTAGAFYTRSELIISSCSFDEHTAIAVGGAIEGGDGSDVTVTDTSFTHGTATSGAAIYSVNQLLVVNCTFDNHTATVAGGAINGGIGASTTIRSSIFTNGTAASGAAVYSASTLSIDSCIFDANIAKTAGGSVYCDACTLKTNRCTFNNNICTNGDGGAMYIEGVATISDSNFTANDAIAHGGAIVVSNSTDTKTLQLSNVQFLKNTAGRAGAAIFSNGVYLNASITVDTVTSFQQNTAVCCYAQGIGSAATNSGIDNSNCQDIDSGGERGAECCVNGQYTNGHQCITCSDRFNCEALGTTTATLPLKPGYWRADMQTQSVLECWESSACSGGNAVSSVQEYCADGYTGPCKYFCLTT
jgi:predicted outer membrane repeat protein